MGWESLNLVATAGSGLIALAVAVYLVNAWLSWRGGAEAGDNPFDADSLEWATSSPPPKYNFLRIPTVAGRYPIWNTTEETPVVGGLRIDIREQLSTSIVDAAPEHKYTVAGPSILPLVLAAAAFVFFCGLIFTPWTLLFGLAAGFVALVLWFWIGAPRSEAPSIARDMPPTEEPSKPMEEPV
jgi:cytochrome c oxidase subunit I+III